MKSTLADLNFTGSEAKRQSFLILDATDGPKTLASQLSGMTENLWLSM